MLTFVISEEHQYTIRDVLETRDHALHGRVIILSYDDFLSLPRLPRSTYLFLDIERLAHEQVERITSRLQHLEAAAQGLRVLNRPDRIGSRMQIMGALKRAGINDFDLLPIDTPPEKLRFPVFLRGISDHDGPKSQLIQNAAELSQAIAALDMPQGYGITEYVDARNADGLHEKRSYMRIGDSLFPSALDTSQHWVCKGEHSDPANVAQPDREIAFLNSDEDREVLRRGFEAAGIDYGRADYAIIDGRPQIFEINTNPWLEPPENVPAISRQGALIMIRRFFEALIGLDAATRDGKRGWVAVKGASRKPAGRMNRRGIFHRALHMIGRSQDETRVMRRLRDLRLL
ncbi:hypothetical protein [Paracoccus sediminicola]|uniref:hypothetical protein n=1 Tax=Paracoccus sediminicola TaxID=3017783 RepID=UPI0022F00F80|nr:hypothetical protein [Paracoccus sediminicola]WBU58189.1 hypothetical protein PAF18_07135 [Paracoccus sediminicola]